MFRTLSSVLSVLLLAGCSVLGDRTGTEEPAYEVVARVGGIEIRRYAPRLAAEVTVAGAEEQARTAGFRKLAAFIFGANAARSDVAMTAPVAQAVARGTEIAMTAPVAAAPEGEGRWTIRFFMPAQFTSQTLPRPTDPDVRIVTLPAETLAVLRFSGSRSAEAMARARVELEQALRATSWRASGPAVDWFYDPPWTLPMLRRNEVAVPVTQAGS